MKPARAITSIAAEGSTPYRFIDVDTLLEDFRKDMENWINGHRKS